MSARGNHTELALYLNRYDAPPYVHDKTRLTEIAYHKKLNRWIVWVSTPGFITHAAMSHYFGYRLQTLIGLLLVVNAIASLVAGYRLERLNALVLLKRVCGGFAFFLFATSIIVGILSNAIYVYLPWVFVYPIGAMLFFGKRAGFYCALAFGLTLTYVLATVPFPEWSPLSLKLIRFNMAYALVAILSLALISERVRTRVQKDLVASQEEYKAAEARQRKANVELQREIDLRIASEELLSQSEMRYRALFEESAVSLWEEDWSRLKIYLDELPQEAADDLPAYFTANPAQLETCARMMRITTVNRATLSLLGADTTKTLIHNIERIMPRAEGINYIFARIIGLYQTGQFQTEVQVQSLNGEPLYQLISSTIPTGFHKTWGKVFTSVYDVTDKVAMQEERRRVEGQLNEARQMQAIATMAGGIAHQFNNALASIYGNVELIEMGSPSSEKQRHINSLRKSAERMSMLTDQLLAYARGGKYLPNTFSVNDLIEELLASDRIEPSPSIGVNLQLAPDIYTASGDTAQIEMVIEAVVSNALESMDMEGQLTISTHNLQITAKSKHPPNLPPGIYIMIQVMDNGSGMDEQTRAHIFEPFFTTKFFGRGLGMAAVYGIVQNHDGVITVDSTPEQGTCVIIYLPGEMDSGSRTRSVA